MNLFWHVRRPSPLRGTATLPGDKSISHRALLLHVLARGEGLVRGLNPGADVQATRRALAALGCAVRDTAEGTRVTGCDGRLRPASAEVDCANSGTTMRLLAGLLAAQPFTTTLDGDASLRQRPMERIASPLRKMGARVDGPNGGRTPPLIVTGGPLRGGRFALPVASAQVKSCLLLAAAAARVEIEIVEPQPTRDHTERMLKSMGADLEHAGDTVLLRAGTGLRALQIDVPKDPSAAALLAAAALAVPGSRITLPAVGVNPGRIGFLGALARMGAAITVQGEGQSGGEPIADLVVESGNELQGLEVGESEVPALVDEIPALAVTCALARGRSHLRGLRELRVKESDRLAGLVHLLRQFGIAARTEQDDLVVDGGTPVAPSEIDVGDDHRMVMAAVALALGALAQASEPTASCRVAHLDAVAVSFTGFVTTLEQLQGRDADSTPADGPAGGQP